MRAELVEVRWSIVSVHPSTSSGRIYDADFDEPQLACSAERAGFVSSSVTIDRKLSVSWATLLGDNPDTISASAALKAGYSSFINATPDGVSSRFTSRRSVS